MDAREPTPRLSAQAAFPALLVLVFLIPFELRRPWVRLGPLEFSNLELAVLAVLAIWTAGLAVGVRRTAGLPFPFRQGSWTAGLTPPAVLLAAILLVAALAATDPLHSLRFWGRFTAGFLVYLAAVSILDTPCRRTGLVAAFAAAGVLAAALVVLEWWGLTVVVERLQWFREAESSVGGRVRPAGTLGYPTIAAMYLEIALAFTLSLIPRWWDHRILRRLPVPAAALMSLALILTLTRAGLLAALAVHAAVLGLWLLHRGWDGSARRFGVSLSLLLLLTGLCAATDPILRLRLTAVPESDWYRGNFEPPSEWRLTTGETAEIPVRIHNRGRVAWKASQQPPLLVSYHWLDAAGNEAVIFDGLRTGLPEDVPAGGTVSVRVRVQAPPRPGSYRLAWNLVMENRFWLADPSSCSFTFVSVGGPVLPAAAPPPPPPPKPVSPDRNRLWGAAIRMFTQAPVLGIGPDRFRLDYGPQLGLQVWDSRVHTNNMYLEFLVGSGLLGAAAFCWLWGAALAVVLRLAGTSPQDDPGPLAATGGATAVLVHGLFDSFWTFTPTYLSIWLVLALVERTRMARCFST